MNPKVDAFFSNLTQWQDELAQLREIVLDCGLTEELKWGVPCYTYKNANIIIIHGFKQYCALMFFKGVLLADSDKILIQQTKNVQETRQVRFTNVKEIAKLEAVLKAYVFEAIEIEKAGLKVPLKKTEDFEMPKELQNKFKENTALKKAFEALTPGRQRGYLLHFTGSQNSKTREARIEKYIPRIIKGQGFNDCVCGLSKRMPNCDGSHKFLKEAKE
ncbi:MAG: DUF1801 domain-containing protein [Flavobacteriales bacterium]